MYAFYGIFKNARNVSDFVYLGNFFFEIFFLYFIGN